MNNLLRLGFGPARFIMRHTGHLTASEHVLFDANEDHQLFDVVSSLNVRCYATKSSGQVMNHLYIKKKKKNIHKAMHIITNNIEYSSRNLPGAFST